MRPSVHVRYSLCFRKNWEACSIDPLHCFDPVAFAYSTSPHRGMRLSWNEEWSASGLGSQFQPPSGHCHSTKVSARRLTFSLSDKPIFEQAASAFPSIEAWARTLPSTFLTPFRCFSPLNHSSTCAVILTA